jgi:hypothetical protein
LFLYRLPHLSQMTYGMVDLQTSLNVGRGVSVATLKKLLINLSLVTFANSHVFFSESPGAGWGSHRGHIKDGLNSTTTFGTINHMLFRSDFISKGSQLSGHFFSFLLTSVVGGPPFFKPYNRVVDTYFIFCRLRTSFSKNPLKVNINNGT